ncbi:hypothetical protein DRJ17_01175 [Candidatus Woesearchaeota archaeon]|nr:MAG: hypothetical protein DRJ17_01175 [Candidatus Woesearchaeota archaeon]
MKNYGAFSMPADNIFQCDGKRQTDRIEAELEMREGLGTKPMRIKIRNLYKHKKEGVYICPSTDRNIAMLEEMAPWIIKWYDINPAFEKVKDTTVIIIKGDLWYTDEARYKTNIAKIDELVKYNKNLVFFLKYARYIDSKTVGDIFVANADRLRNKIDKRGKKGCLYIVDPPSYIDDILTIANIYNVDNIRKYNSIADIEL